MKRLFLALQVPSLWQPVLDRAANGLANTRWLSAQNRHITLGRCKKVDQSKLREYLSIWPELQAPQVTADRLRLYQSHLDPKGASYEIVGEWVLA